MDNKNKYLKTIILDNWKRNHMQDPNTIINEETIWHGSGDPIYTMTSNHQISTNETNSIYHIMFKYKHTLG